MNTKTVKNYNFVIIHNNKKLCFFYKKMLDILYKMLYIVIVGKKNEPTKIT